MFYPRRNFLNRNGIYGLATDQAPPSLGSWGGLTWLEVESGLGMFIMEMDKFNLINKFQFIKFGVIL